MKERRLSTIWLLVLVFSLAFVLLLAVGASIQWQAQQVQRQAQAIMQNGLRSVLAANSLNELINTFDHSERHPDSPGEFERTATRFSAIITEELQATEFFPGEKEELQRLSRMLAHYRALIPHSPTAVMNAHLEQLKRATDHFNAINQQGMKEARETLDNIAIREIALLRMCFALILCGWLSLAYLLARAIARPLQDLTAAVRTMPEKLTHPEIRFGRLTPVEIEQLANTFKRSAEQLEQLDRLRQTAEEELRSALEREHRLNSELDEQVSIKTQELAQANADLLDLVSELRGKDRQKAAFLATVSHELRTPLAIIQATVQTLQNPRLNLNREHIDGLLFDVIEEVHSLSSLVEDLLDVASMNANTFTIHREEEVDLNQLIQTVAKGFGASMANNEVTLEWELCPEMPLVTVDPQRISQILRNLLDNAAKYTPSGSLVRLTVAYAFNEEGEGWVETCVEDSGQGIPDAIKSRLFERFVRDTDSGKPGLGLGLAIARELVEAHGGKMGVGSSSLGGSRFWFQLPVNPLH